MNAFVTLQPVLYDRVMAHLLPPGIREEQSAFLFARGSCVDQQITFEAIEAETLGRRDFAAQEGDYLQIADATMARLIKKAHDLGASLVELHSHTGPWPAAFSPSDRAGLAETVPHMWWRLRKRPYIAIVVADSGFDALLWLDNPRLPRAIDGIIAGNRLHRPTNHSLGGWH